MIAAQKAQKYFQQFIYIAKYYITFPYRLKLGA